MDFELFVAAFPLDGSCVSDEVFGIPCVRRADSKKQSDAWKVVPTPKATRRVVSQSATSGIFSLRVLTYKSFRFIWSSKEQSFRWNSGLSHEVRAMFHRLQRNERENGRFAASRRLSRGSYYGVNAGGSASLSRPIPAIIRTSATPSGKSNLPARI